MCWKEIFILLNTLFLNKRLRNVSRILGGLVPRRCAPGANLVVRTSKNEVVSYV
jgi:hypothetical protein